MRSRYRVNEPHAVYFVTSTVVAWLPVFTTAVRCDILIQSLEYCRNHKELKLYAWVILDNHLHLIATAPNLPRVLADFKRHTAQRLIAQLEVENCEWLLISSATFAQSTRPRASIKYGRKARIHKRLAVTR